MGMLGIVETRQKDKQRYYLEINVYCLFRAIQLNLNHRIAGQKSKNKQPSFPCCNNFFVGHEKQMDGQTKRTKKTKINMNGNHKKRVVMNCCNVFMATRMIQLSVNGPDAIHTAH